MRNGELYHLQLFLGPAGNTYFIRRRNHSHGCMWKCSKRCQRYCSCCLSFCERGRTHYHRARLLKEQSLGPKVLRDKRKPLRNTTRSEMGGAARCFWGRMLGGPRLPADLHPRKSACAGEKQKQRAWRNRFERRKRKAHWLYLKGFLFLNTTVLSRRKMR